VGAQGLGLNFLDPQCAFAAGKIIDQLGQHFRFRRWKAQAQGGAGVGKSLSQNFDAGEGAEAGLKAGEVGEEAVDLPERFFDERGFFGAAEAECCRAAIGADEAAAA
jgi:hypothetical protein